MDWNGLLQSAAEFWTTIESALVIIIVGIILSNLLGKFVKKSVSKLKLHKAFRAAGINIKPAILLGNGVRYLGYIISVIVALDKLGIATFLLSVVVIAILVLVIVAVSLGIKDFIPNLISGISILSKHKFKEGYEIEINDAKGVIESINLLETKLKTKKGDVIFIPNSLLAKKKVIIHRRTRKK